MQHGDKRRMRDLLIGAICGYMGAHTLFPWGMSMCVFVTFDFLLEGRSLKSMGLRGGDDRRVS